MSGTENEAVEAGARAAYESDEVFLPWESAGEDYAATYRRDAKTHYDAMREIIARDVIAGVCRREGHLRLNTTSLGSAVLEIRCGGCPEVWTKPRPRRATSEPDGYMAVPVPAWQADALKKALDKQTVRKFFVTDDQRKASEANDSALLALPVYVREESLTCNTYGCPCDDPYLDIPGRRVTVREIAEAIRKHQNDNPRSEL